MDTNHEIVFNGTTVEIDGDTWLVILLPLKQEHFLPFPPTIHGIEQFDVESSRQKFFGQSLVFAIRGTDGQYQFSVPASFQQKIRSKIPPDFDWKEMHFPL